MKQFSYEKPNLISFSGMEEVYGNCDSGTSAHGSGDNCNPLGASAAGPDCNSGASAGDSHCSVGGVALGQKCSAGGTAGTDCDVGTSAP